MASLGVPRPPWLHTQPTIPWAPGCVLVSPSLRGWFWGLLPQTPRGTCGTGGALCFKLVHSLESKNQLLILTMTQPRGEVPVITRRESGWRRMSRKAKQRAVRALCNFTLREGVAAVNPSWQDKFTSLLFCKGGAGRRHAGICYHYYSSWISANVFMHMHIEIHRNWGTQTSHWRL